MNVTRFHHVIEYRRAVQGESAVQVWITDPAGNTIELQQDAGSR